MTFTETEKTMERAEVTTRDFKPVANFFGIDLIKRPGQSVITCRGEKMENENEVALADIPGALEARFAQLHA